MTSKMTKIANYRVITRKGPSVARYYTRVFVSVEALSATGKRVYAHGGRKSPFAAIWDVGIEHYRSGMSRATARRLSACQQRGTSAIGLTSISDREVLRSRMGILQTQVQKSHSQSAKGLPVPEKPALCGGL